MTAIAKFFSFALPATILFAAAPTRADDSPAGTARSDAPKDEPKEESRSSAGPDHVELTMGFVAGQRSYTDVSFKFKGGPASSIGGGQIVAPFAKYPFNRVAALGLRYDARLVVNHIRMTVGFDRPFTAYRPGDATGTYKIGDAMRTVTVQSLSPKELRFGLGGEYPVGRVSPFVDVIGGVHWIDTTFVVDGQSASYSATTFAFSLRGGLRIHARPWFFAAAAGEIGLYGDLRWNAELSVGAAFP